MYTLLPTLALRAQVGGRGREHYEAHIPWIWNIGIYIVVGGIGEEYLARGRVLYRIIFLGYPTSISLYLSLVLSLPPRSLDL